MNRNEDMRVEKRNERNGRNRTKGVELRERVWIGIEKSVRESDEENE